LLALNPHGKVPVLIDQGLVVWDSLAIAEYVAEKFPQLNLWPSQAPLRARARSLCADIHSGYTALRQHCGMNIEADLRDVGKSLWSQKADLREDVQRLCQVLTKTLSTQSQPHMLMGEFGIVDAFYAPVCSRIRTYGLPVNDVVQGYVNFLKDEARRASKSAAVNELGVSPRWILNMDARAGASGSGMYSRRRANDANSLSIVDSALTVPPPRDGGCRWGPRPPPHQKNQYPTRERGLQEGLPTASVLGAYRPSASQAFIVAMFRSTSGLPSPT
jgi:glutathione S-transferase